MQPTPKTIRSGVVKSKVIRGSITLQDLGTGVLGCDHHWSAAGKISLNFVLRLGSAIQGATVSRQTA
jgi:hypothetical protein